jgi:hypothetical protein
MVVDIRPVAQQDEHQIGYRPDPRAVTRLELNERLLNIPEEDLRAFIEATLGFASTTYQSVLTRSVDQQAGLQYAIENTRFAAQGMIVYLNRLEERNG